MRRARVSKLKLTRETLRNLRTEPLGQVLGGTESTHANCHDIQDYTGACGTGIGCNTYTCTFYCSNPTGQQCTGG